MAVLFIKEDYMYNSIFDNYLLAELDTIIPGTSARAEAKREKFFSLLLYLRQIIAGAVAMCDMDGIPDGLDFRYLELFRYTNGHIGIMKHDKYGLVCFPGSFAGELDAYGRGTEYVGALLNGEPMSGTKAGSGEKLRGKIGVDCVVIPNNYLYTNDFPMFYSFAKRLAEVDTSLDLNVFYARLAPLIKVADQKTKEAVDGILNNILVGELKSIIQNDIESDLEGFKSIEVFNITDVKDVDKLQYLSKYHDDLLRRLYILGGHSMAGTQKMAQQSAYEIGQNDTIAMIYPMERLNCLKDGVERMNKLFGTSATVSFSEAWQVEKEKIETSIATANMAQSGMAAVPEEPEANGSNGKSEEEDTKNETE